MLTWIRWPASKAADRSARGTSRLRNIEIQAACVAPAPKGREEAPVAPAQPGACRSRRLLHPSLVGLTEVSAHRVPSCHLAPSVAARCRIGAQGNLMNNIIYIVGLVVIVIFILGFFGLR